MADEVQVAIPDGPIDENTEELWVNGFAFVSVAQCTARVEAMDRDWRAIVEPIALRIEVDHDLPTAAELRQLRAKLGGGRL